MFLLSEDTIKIVKEQDLNSKKISAKLYWTKGYSVENIKFLQINNYKTINKKET